MRTTENTLISGFKSKKFIGKYVMLVSHGRMMNHPSANPNFAKKIDIKFIVLNDAYDGGTPNSSHYDLSNEDNFDTSQISSGELFLAMGGSVWRDGMLQWYPAVDLVLSEVENNLSTLNINCKNVTMVKYGALKEYLNTYGALLDEDSNLCSVDQDNGSKVFIPAVELFRFYWSGSKCFTSDLLNSKVENLDSFCVIGASMLRENGDAAVLVRKRYRVSDARMIARMICSNRNGSDKYSIAHQSAMYPFLTWQDKTKPTYIQAKFPFNDETAIEGYVIPLSNGDSLMLGIAYCGHSFPFKDIYARIDKTPIIKTKPLNDTGLSPKRNITVYENNAPLVRVDSMSASNLSRFAKGIKVSDKRFAVKKIKSLANPEEKKMVPDSDSTNITHDQTTPINQSLTPGGSAGDLPGTNLDVNNSEDKKEDKKADKNVTVINPAIRVKNLFDYLESLINTNTEIHLSKVSSVEWWFGENKILVDNIEVTSCPFSLIEGDDEDVVDQNIENQKFYGTKARWIAVIKLKVTIKEQKRVYYLIEVGVKNSGYALNLLYNSDFSDLDNSVLLEVVERFRNYFSNSGKLSGVFNITDKNLLLVRREGVNHAQNELAEALAAKVFAKIEESLNL